MIEQNMPSKTLTLQIEGNEYEVKVPDTGQFIDIETRKIQYSKQQADGLLAKATEGSIKASFLIDMIATFHVLIPQLEKDINTPSLFRLDQMKTAKLLDIYLKQYYPWEKEWQTVINNSTIEKKDEE